MSYTNITPEFLAWLEKRGTKVAQRSLKAMDRDIATCWKCDDDILLMEPTTTIFSIPDYLYDQWLLFKKAYAKER